MKTHIILEESDIAGKYEDGNCRFTLTAKNAMRTAELVTFGDLILKHRDGYTTADLKRNFNYHHAR